MSATKKRELYSVSLDCQSFFLNQFAVLLALCLKKWCILQPICTTSTGSLHYGKFYSANHWYHIYFIFKI